jgi:hypothetical protein
MKATEDTHHKFSTTGEVLRFQGNTVICAVRESAGAILGELNRAQQRLKDLPGAGKYIYLPPSSFHMTVIRLTDQTHRNTSFWPASFSPDCDMAEIDRAFKRAVDAVRAPASLRMRVDSCTAWRVNLVPHDQETHLELVRFRDEVAAETGVRYSDHDEYRFHITLGYRLADISTAEHSMEEKIVTDITERLIGVSGVFVLDAPEFVVFDDMLSFHTDLTARNQA